jgi:hypothetical protein
MQQWHGIRIERGGIPSQLRFSAGNREKTFGSQPRQIPVTVEALKDT